MNRAGFTLLELTVALTIAAAVTAAGYGALAGVIDARRAAREEIDDALRAAAVRRSLTAWLADASVAGRRDWFVAQDGETHGHANDEVVFVTSGVPPYADGPATVRLAIDRDAATQERGLVADILTADKMQRVEIVPEAVALETRFLRRHFSGDAWLPAWNSSVELPAAVELRIAVPEGAPLPPLLSLPLVAVIGR